MKGKLITLQHHADDYECMWNGIEDLYIRDTGQTLPPNFFFSLASFGAFCYMKTPKSELKRMLALGDGRTKQMYKFLAPIVGFEYRHYEYKLFQQAITKAKKEVFAGYPVVLGALDMYHLPYYPKLYHMVHIPFHYNLMVGYDDDAQCIYVYDCGHSDLQTLSYDELSYAWDCSYPGLSKPYTLCTIRMNTTKDKYQIAKEALAKRSEMFLNPPVSFIGRKGFEKFIHELPKLKYELDKEDYDKLLTNMVMFFGEVPTLPNALLGINEPDKVKYGGGFDKMSRVLYDLGLEYDNKSWLDISERFKEGADIISQITNSIVSYLTGKCDDTEKVPALFKRVKEIMTNGFEHLR